MTENFKVTAWYYWLIAVLLLGTIIVCAYCHESIPYTSLGFVGDFLHWYSYAYPILPQLMVWVVAAIHLGEGIYAFKLTRDAEMSTSDTILWTAQTIVVGFTSLIPLKAVCKNLKKKPH